MERIKRLLGAGDAPEQAYEPLEGGSEQPDGFRTEDTMAPKFSWTEYSIFLLLGVAMLWAWYAMHWPGGDID
jgi:equilibrative nucleoside transporter 1/2/3